MKKLNTIICIAMVMGSNVFCQAQIGGAEIGKHSFLSVDQISRIPFQADLDHIVITPTINGKSRVRLILDTGMPMAGLILIGRENKGDWGLNFRSEFAAPDSPQNEEPQPSAMVQGVRLDFPGLELTNLTAIVEPPDGSLGRMLRDVDGIVGLEIFGQFAVTIDYDHHEIILEESANFKVPAGAEELPLIMRSGFAWITCSAEMATGVVVPLELVVDLGAAHALSLNAGTNANIVPPGNAIETVLGKTVSGLIHGKVGRIRNLRLGNQILKDVMTSFQTGERHGPSAMEKEGNVGNDVLRRFNVSLDYKKKRLILVPNSHFKDPFEYNMSGIEYSRTPDENLKVERILPGSPGEQSDLKAGDIIFEIAGRPVSGISKDELRRILRARGSTISLLALSPEKVTKRIALTLRRVI